MAAKLNGSRAVPTTTSDSSFSPDVSETDKDGRSRNIVAAALQYGRRSEAFYSKDALNGSNTPESTAVNPPEPTEFPFGSTNGANGVLPTNPLSNFARRAVGSSSVPPQEAEASATAAHPPVGHDPDPIGTSTPPRRRSVQFADDTQDAEERAQFNAAQAVEADNNAEASVPSRSSKFKSKLRSMTPPAFTSASSKRDSGHYGGDSAISEDTPASFTFPAWADRGIFHKRTRSDTGADDADAEQSAEEHDSPGMSTKKSGLQLQKERIQFNRSAPTTPRAFDYTDGEYFAADSPSSPRQPIRLRRATYATEDSRQGFSEDEGRERLEKASTWRRRSTAFLHNRGQSYSGSRRQSTQETSDASRPSNFRRITAFAATSQGPDGSPSPWRVKSEIGAQKWRQLKAGLKMMGQKRKEQSRIDQVKSGELVAELLAGSPAALILAGSFLRDEKEKKKVPILLEQLKVSITDSQRREDSAGDRHVFFRLELEYGSGITRMQWTIWRSLRDFANLHMKCKLQSGTEKYIHRTAEDARAKLPRFPRSAFPYLRGVRGLTDEDYEEEDIVEDLEGPTGPNSAIDPLAGDRALSRDRDATDTIATPVRERRRLALDTLTRRSTGADGNLSPATPFSGVVRKELYAERQRKKLESYLRDLIRYLFFRAGSNRLCRFLELSALGVRLAGEGGYHGKEGLMVLLGSKGVDFRKATKPHLLIERHRPMWFLVRQSYIVCVDSPETMNIYDIFLVDMEFSFQSRRPRLRDQKRAKDIARTAKDSAAHPQNHFLRLRNSERSLNLLARNDRQLMQFEESLNYMTSSTDWTLRHRFDSFAPTRKEVFAQWFVDGRDYMWNLSKAISMARDVIYIHDWWLSPELYMRRPAATNQRWRLDRLLKQKAEEGVKIFVIVYRNINSTIPIDSEWTKFSLLDLHPNIFVQRSPNQVRQNVFFWAHHEKFCVIDDVIAFVGGIDLCYGRWDTPQHTVADDKPTGFDIFGPKDADHCQTFVGKDYSNARAGDFHDLNDPYSTMYDRTKVPRMPWHDVGMEAVGQPARDLVRHFVQRWNYILRQRKPSRPTPFLLPPPDFEPGDIKQLGLHGTCNVQMLRSAADWSIGTPDRTEQSIMNAYCKLIQTSEHFIYIENQFFVTSCTVDGTKVENRIGDALVERIIRAHQESEDWLAVIVIPLMPGFEKTVESPEGAAIRLIMQCQFRSICRGPTSIFERLRAVSINPEDYIRFYGLRSWGMIGPDQALVTEQLYVHAKIMVADDRYAIIGSANINERSMLGSRDSEVAAIVYDSDMIDSVMAGEKYKVGRFPHTLRMRLMREHLGLDVDQITAEERAQPPRHKARSSDEKSNPSSTTLNPSDELGPSSSRARLQEEIMLKLERMHSFNHDVDWEQENNPHLKTSKKMTSDQRVTGNAAHRKDVEGHGPDNMILHENALRGQDSVRVSDKEALVTNDGAEGNGGPTVRENSSNSSPPSSSGDDSGSIKAAFPPPQLIRMHTIELGLTQLSQLPALPVEDDTDIGGPPLQRLLTQTSDDSLAPLLSSMRRPIVEKDCMRDPLNDAFFQDTWHTVAENNTKLYRQVFRCMPDNEVTNWREFEAFVAYEERFAQSQGLGKSSTRIQQEARGKTGPPGHGTTAHAERLNAVKEKVKNAADAAEGQHAVACDEKDSRPRGMSGGTTQGQQKHGTANEPAVKSFDRARNDGANEKDAEQSVRAGRPHIDFEELPAKEKPVHVDGAAADSHAADAAEANQPHKRRRRTTVTSRGTLRATDPLLGKDQAEGLLRLVQGHLVVWPYDWLYQEERGGKWLYSLDQMAPLEVYN